MACEIYQTLLRTLARNLAPLDATILYAPAGASNELQPLVPPHWSFHEQQGATLGERLSAAFHHAFAASTTSVVIIGSDCPFIMPQDIFDAWHALRKHDLVLGPAEDGGYWLIGLRSHHPSLFQEIQWSTASVLEQTLSCAKSLGLSHHLLRTLHDIDTPADWERFKTHLTTP